MQQIPTAILHSMYRKMLTIRHTEQSLLAGFKQGKFLGTVHTCIGQEAVPVGISEALDSSSVFFSNHRGHGHMLAKGVSVSSFINEIAGNNKGQCAGLGGSQHIAAPDVGFMGSNGIVAGAVPIAVGYAYANKKKNNNVITVVFFSDGASSQGVLYEAMNMAVIWKVPVLFVCENNKYAMSSPANNFISSSLYGRASSFGIQSYTVDGMDACSVYKKVLSVKDYIVENGPVFIEADTYRFSGHSKSDQQLYRSKAEVAQWKAKDPIDRLKALIPVIDAKQIEDEVKKSVSSVARSVGVNYNV